MNDRFSLPWSGNPNGELATLFPSEIPELEAIEDFSVEISDSGVLFDEVYISATDRLALESGFNTGEFQISRFNTSEEDLTINFRLRGRAIRGVDYILTDANDNPITGDTITIPAGEYSVPIKVHAIADGVLESDEGVRMEILSGDESVTFFPNVAFVRIINLDTPISVKIEPQDPYTLENVGEPGKFKISRSDNVGDLAVNFQTLDVGSGTAIFGVDYILTDANGNPLSGDSITIPNGAFSSDLGVRAIDDTLNEGVETVGIALGGDTHYAVSPSSSSAQMDILEKTPISVAVTDSYAYEGSDSGFYDDRNGSFWVTRLGTSGDLTVDFNIDTSDVRSATVGEDYILTDGNGTPLTGNRITIPNGGSSAEILVQPIDDSFAENYETVQLQFPDTEDYTVVSATGADGSDDLIVGISDNEPIAFVYASNPLSSEVGPDSGEFTIFGSTSSSIYIDPFTVDFELVDPVTGNPATLGIDYTLTDENGNPLTDTEILIPGGFGYFQTKLRVNPIPDAENDGNEVVRLRLVDDPTLGYSVSSWGSTADVVVTDENTIVVETLHHVDENGAENDYSGVLLLTRQGTSGDAIVNFEIDTTDIDDYSNPATRGEDYILLDDDGMPLTSNTVTIPNGGSAAAILVQPIDDTVGEGNETVNLKFLDGEDFTVAASPPSYNGYTRDASTATVTIWDDEPQVGLYSWDDRASEVDADPGYFHLYRYPYGGDVTVYFDILTDIGTNAQAAELGVDYTLTDINGNPILGNSITIPSGQPSIDLQVHPIADSVDDPDEIVRLQLVNDPTLGYSVSPFSPTATADVVISETPSGGIIFF